MHHGGTVGLWASISTCRIPGTSSWISFSSLSTSHPKAVTTSSPAMKTQVFNVWQLRPKEKTCFYNYIAHYNAYHNLTWSWAVQYHPPFPLHETVYHQIQSDIHHTCTEGMTFFSVNLVHAPTCWGTWSQMVWGTIGPHFALHPWYNILVESRGIC